MDYTQEQLSAILNGTHPSYRNLSLSGGDFPSASFRSKDLTGSNLTGSKFGILSIYTSKGSGVSFHNCRLRAGSWESSAFTNSDFQYTIFAGMKIHRVEFHGCDFTKARFEGVKLSQVVFKNCNLEEATFRDCSYFGTIQGCDVDGADFGGSDISNLNVIALRGDRVNLQGASRNDMWERQFKGVIHE